MADAKEPMGVMIAQIIKLSEDVAVVVTEVIGLKEDVAELKKETKELSKTVDRNSFVLGVGIVLVMIGKDNLSDWFKFLSPMVIVVTIQWKCCSHSSSIVVVWSRPYNCVRRVRLRIDKGSGGGRDLEVGPVRVGVRKAFVEGTKRLQKRFVHNHLIQQWQWQWQWQSTQRQGRCRLLNPEQVASRCPDRWRHHGSFQPPRKWDSCVSRRSQMRSGGGAKDGGNYGNAVAALGLWWLVGRRKVGGEVGQGGPGVEATQRVANER